VPIYEYRCAKCEQTFEVVQSAFEPLALCGEHCRAEGCPGDGALERLISLPAKPARGGIPSGKIDYQKAAAKGFTTYKRKKKGHYERVAGAAGPGELVAPKR
jgi:putative FmdB family regulatory protein